jgi:hypothetical protein
MRRNRDTKKVKTPTPPRIEDITPSGEAQAVVDALNDAVDGYLRWTKYHGRGYSEETEKAFTAWLWDNQKALARMVEAVYLSTESSPVDLPDPDTALNRVRLVQAALDAEDAAFKGWEKALKARTKALATWDKDYGATYAKADARLMRASQQWADTRKAIAGAIRLTRNLPRAFRATYSIIEPRGAKGRVLWNLSYRMDEGLRNAWNSISSWENMNEHDLSPSGPNPDYRAFLRDKTGEPIQRLLKDVDVTRMLERMPSRGFIPSKDERVTMEGFNILLRDYDPKDTAQSALLDSMRAGLRVFRKQAERYFPEMLHPPYTRYPITLDMGDRDADYGGFNRNGAVLMNGRSWWTPESFAGVLAHEMGHTAYMLLSSSALEAWNDLVSEDGTFQTSELFSLARELGLNPEKNSLNDLADRLNETAREGKVEHEWLYNQIITALSEYVGGRHKTGRAETLRYMPGGSLSSPLRVPMAQVSEVSFPINPTTAYGGNNPDEALAETFKHYVVDGPRAVNPRVRALFQRIFSGLRRNPDEDDTEVPFPSDG